MSDANNDPKTPKPMGNRHIFFCILAALVIYGYLPASPAESDTFKAAAFGTLLGSLLTMLFQWIFNIRAKPPASKDEHSES